MGRSSDFASFAYPSRASERIGVYNHDVREGVTRGDERLAELFGVRPEDCVRGLPIQTFFAAMHPDDRERVERSVDRAIEQGGAFIERYRTLAGGGMDVRATGFCFRDKDGQPSVFVGTVELVNEADETAANVDRTIEYALAAYRLAGHAHRRKAQYLIALALEDMGFVLPKPGADH